MAPDTGFLSIRTLEEEFHERSAPPPSIARVFGALGFLVFGVAMGGLYGLTSFLATMRRREIGIRKALGATTMTLVRMLARESSPMLLAGIGVGLTVGALVASLFVRPGSNVHVFDPVPLLIVAGFLYTAGLAGVVAPYVAAMRASTDGLRD